MQSAEDTQGRGREKEEREDPSSRLGPQVFAFGRGGLLRETRTPGEKTPETRPASHFAAPPEWRRRRGRPARTRG